MIKSRRTFKEKYWPDPLAHSKAGMLAHIRIIQFKIWIAT